MNPGLQRWEAELASLTAEWISIHRFAEAAIPPWERKLAQMQADEARLRDAGRWVYGRDDFLAVLGRERDELTHSRMIAWLLDPCAPHGFGTRILEDLLTTTFGQQASREALVRVKTRCEVQLAEGRLDVVVEGPGLQLVIENKVDAAEGDAQCSYYSENLPAEALCILLSPDGRESRTESTFKPLKYSRLADIISHALAANPGSTNGRRVVEDYLRTLRMEFP